MKFIGREEQLKKLDRVINKEELTFSLIYGRRRVGKSELVKQAIKRNNVKSFYYECKQVSEVGNATGLGEIVSEIRGLPKLDYSDIEAVLKYIFELSVKENIILVLDEYPYLRENIKGMDSILQSLVDKYKDTSKLTLIILGSYVEVMRSLLEHSNPLYGRVDLTID